MSPQDGSETAESQAIDLGDLHGIVDGALVAFAQHGDHGVVICRVNGALYALADQCSHANTPLSSGRLRGFKLICPRHGASFDVRDGSHSGPPAIQGVACYQVSESATAATLTIRRRSPR